MKRTLLIAVLSITIMLGSCSYDYGGKVSEYDFVSQIRKNRNSFNDSISYTFSAKGSSFYDYNGNSNTKAYDSTYIKGENQSDNATNVLNIIKDDLTMESITVRLIGFSYLPIEYTFYLNKNNNFLAATATYVDSENKNYKLDFEYRWNNYGLLTYAKEYLLLPNKNTAKDDYITTNLEITWTFAV